METKVVGIESGCLLEIIEIPYSEKYSGFRRGDEVIYKTKKKKKNMV